MTTRASKLDHRLPKQSPISRRDALSALIALSSGALGCVASVQRVGDIDFRRVDRDHVVLIGRVWVHRYGNLTPYIAIETNEASLGGYQLDASATVAWLIPRPPADLRLLWLSSNRMTPESGPHGPGSIHLGDRGPLLMPRGAPAPIVYFGTITFNLEHDSHSPFDWTARSAVGQSQIGARFRQDDDDANTLSGLLLVNPSLAGMPYFHLPSGQMRQVWTQPPRQG